MIDVNVYHYFMLHKMFLTKHLERTKQGKKSLLMGTASCIWLGPVRPFVHYAATKGASGYLSTALNFELAREGLRSDGSNTSLVEMHCSTPFGVGTNLVKSPHKEHCWKNFTNTTQQYCDSLEANIGQWFYTYGNFYMEIMTILGFKMA